MKQDTTLKQLQIIPGVGPSIAQDLVDLGIRKVDDLIGRDPETMYEKSCRLAGVRIDRCLLYVYRCAVYFAGTKRPEPELLKWWNWKDAKSTGRSRTRSRTKAVRSA